MIAERSAIRTRRWINLTPLRFQREAPHDTFP